MRINIEKCFGYVACIPEGDAFNNSSDALSLLVQSYSGE